ncbi:hypothetical protein OKA04_04590 [Luteolibacter flavescens]|uniref:Uncharacterized protein n=1 Tax=Luteolibacter flavescens TaxID=1859460 RepID=A0ABT3FKY2_9BACT|nr:hypothetical protein [Luteolibacter flavescens]MCW1883994.1 hypothetical protein [Luteolibacter flavescens]
MTPKQMALSRLARLALNAASDSPPKEHADVCTLVATALHDDCPDLSVAAAAAAKHFSAASEAEADLLSQLNH